jgi:ATP phosphoribosyltransferase regulatory subunit
MRKPGTSCRRLVDIRALSELERFLNTYTSAEESAAFANLIQLSGRSEIFARARQVITNTRSRAALDRLESLWRIIESIGYASNFEIDLGDVARLDYYTGLTFKIYVGGLGVRLGSGGRYDHLTGKFGRAEPAVGFVVELDALAELLAKEEQPICLINPENLLVSFDVDDAGAVFQKAMKLRAANRQVRIDGEELHGPADNCHSQGEIGGRDFGIVCGRQASSAGASRSAQLACLDESGETRFIFVKPSDVPVYVEHGIADCGVVGRDVLFESEADLLQPLSLEIGSCRIASRRAGRFARERTRNAASCYQVSAHRLPLFRRARSAGRDHPAFRIGGAGAGAGTRGLHSRFG